MPDLEEPPEILMVEDSAADAELALRAFKLADLTNPVTVVADGEEGLDYLFGTGAFEARGPTRPRLILLDLGLPKMTGVDFLHHLRADGRTCDIPVVVLSLSDSNAGVTTCIRCEGVAYIIKPVSFEKLTRIAGVLNLRLIRGEPTAHRESGGWMLTGSGAGPDGSSQGGLAAESTPVASEEIVPAIEGVDGPATKLGTKDTGAGELNTP